jgi:RNA polymerase sigma factor (sigma-70 family)
MRTEDGHIIYKCLNEDSAAFGLLVDKYKASIFSIAYSMLRNFHDAEDVTQDVFIKAYKNLSTLRRWDNFLSWICSMAYNLCRDRIKAQSIRKENERLERKNKKELDDNSVNSYREEQVFESLHEALDSLPDIYREVLTLHYLGGISSEQIARILSIPYATVRQRLSRARAQLREEILTMVSETYEQQRLKAIFTFRIVEMVKQIKVNPISTAKGLPWGLSLATGFIIAFLGFGTHLNMPSNFDMATSSSLSPESKVLRVGEFSVDVLKVSNIPVMSNGSFSGNGLSSVVPSLQNALFMAPQAEGGTWTKKTDMPKEKWGLAVSTVNNKIYTIGGSAKNGDAVYSTVEEYDPETDKWGIKTNMSTERANLASTALNGKIYAIGGTTDILGIQLVEEYDPVENKWKKKADMPTARLGLSACAVNGKIYAIGGGQSLFVDSYLPTVEEYDPVNDIWIEKADMPTARGVLATSVVNGKIYAIGGCNQMIDAFTYTGLSTVEEYDPVKDKWSKKADMPTPRFGLSTVVVKDKIYAISGADRRPATPVVEIYDPATDIWTNGINIPTARAFLGADKVGGKIYVFGGNDNWVGLSTVEEFDTGLENQSINFKGKLPTTWGEVRTVMNR